MSTPTFPVHDRMSNSSLRTSSYALPAYRHAAPCGPWPFLDIAVFHDDHCAPLRPLGSCEHGRSCNVCKQWTGYPQSQFANWTVTPVQMSGITNVVKCREDRCTIYHIDVFCSGKFGERGWHLVTKENKRDYWTDTLSVERGPGIRLRALFLDNLSGPVLQMLGTKYNVEPFFWSSSLSRIPTTYQENVQPKKGDHVTITLVFLRPMRDSTSPVSSPSSNAPTVTSDAPTRDSTAFASQWRSLNDFVVRITKDNVIDTQAPLALSSIDKVLVLDLLSIHMDRGAERPTMISYHPDAEYTTSAHDLQTRFWLAGKSVYWQKVFERSSDPTILLLPPLWHALYAWDEALGALYSHFCTLESRILVTNNIILTQELHIMHAHLLYYASLLEDFRASVEFVLNTPNPAMDSDNVDESERENCRVLLTKECNNLLSAIKRLEMNRGMLDNRSKNAMDLVFASTNIGDSKAMKRLSFITMIFLPAAFLASVFGMNVKELDDATKASMMNYVEAVVPFTALTIWFIIAFQSKETKIWKRALWPILAAIAIVAAFVPRRFLHIRRQMRLPNNMEMYENV